MAARRRPRLLRRLLAVLYDIASMVCFMFRHVLLQDVGTGKFLPLFWTLTLLHTTFVSSISVVMIVVCLYSFTSDVKVWLALYNPDP